jgi:hypothetical protein
MASCDFSRRSTAIAWLQMRIPVLQPFRSARGQQFEQNYLQLRSIRSLLDGLAQWPCAILLVQRRVDHRSITRPYAPLDQRMRAFVAYEKSVAAALDRSVLIWRRRTRHLCRSGRLTFGGLAVIFNDCGIFQNVRREAQADFETSNAARSKPSKSLDSWFESQRAATNDIFALGASLFRALCHRARRCPHQSAQIGHADMERNLSTLRISCASSPKGKRAVRCQEVAINQTRQWRPRANSSPSCAPSSQPILSHSGYGTGEVDEAPPCSAGTPHPFRA